MKTRRKTFLKEKKKIIVFYHDDHDGFGAAWVAWKKFKNSARYIPIDHPTHFQDIKRYNLFGAEIYFLDICLNKEDMEHVRRVASRVIVIDHHISKKDVVASFSGSVFDIGHSGAFLAWKYFCAKEPVPKIIHYVQDEDLFTFKMHGSEALFIALPWTFSFGYWNKLARVLENKTMIAKYIKIGAAMLRYRNIIVEALTDTAEKTRILGISAFAVNSALEIIESHVGHALTKKEKGTHVGIVYQIVDNGAKIKVGLRSDGKVDVSKMAQKFGGGGHKRASSFTWDLKKGWPFKFIKQ